MRGYLSKKIVGCIIKNNRKFLKISLTEIGILLHLRYNSNKHKRLIYIGSKKLTYIV